MTPPQAAGSGSPPPRERERDVSAEPRNDNPVGDVVVWWTPDCGYLHVETNPLTVPVHCPDDVVPEVPA